MGKFIPVSKDTGKLTFSISVAEPSYESYIWPHIKRFSVNGYAFSALADLKGLQVPQNYYEIRVKKNIHSVKH